MSREYTCEGCGGTFTPAPGWSEEDAAKEAEQLFGAPVPEDDRAILCDDCYKQFLAWFETLTPADHAAIRLGTYTGQRFLVRHPKP